MSRWGRRREDPLFYWVFRRQGGDVIALPEGHRQLWRPAIAATPAHSARTAALRFVVAGVFRSRLHPLKCIRFLNPLPRLPGFDWRGLRAQLHAIVGREDCIEAVRHPPQSLRGRFYVHMMDPRGQSLAFVKVSVDDANSHLLEAEEGALRNAVPEFARSFSVPRILGSGVHDRHRFLVFEPIPAHAGRVRARWNGCMDTLHQEIAGPAVRRATLRACSWWAATERSRATEGWLWEAVLRESDIDVWTRRAHGDFVHWNMCVEGGRTWVYDWESYCPDAPILSDPLRFFLGANTRSISRSPAWVARAVIAKFVGDSERNRRQVMRALAFLMSRGVNEANIIARELV